MSRRLEMSKAYAFSCPLDLEALRSRLDEVGPWDWIERESHWWGDYISAGCKRDYAILKIYETGEPGYQIDIRFESEGPAAQEEWEAFHADILDRLLPAIPAGSVHPTETMN